MSFYVSYVLSFSQLVVCLMILWSRVPCFFANKLMKSSDHLNPAGYIELTTEVWNKFIISVVKYPRSFYFSCFWGGEGVKKYIHVHGFWRTVRRQGNCWVDRGNVEFQLQHQTVHYVCVYGVVRPGPTPHLRQPNQARWLVQLTQQENLMSLSNILRKSSL